MTETLQTEPPLLDRLARNPWWFAIVLLVPSLVFSVWFVVASLTPHTWTIPPEGKLTYARGTFSHAKGSFKNPYGFKTLDGGFLRLSCYPELSANYCLSDAGIGLDQIAGRETVIGYFTVSTSDPLMAFLYSSSPDIVMTAKVSGGPSITYEQSLRRLQLYSTREESDKLWVIPLGLSLSTFLTILGSLIAYAKFRAARTNQRAIAD